MEAEVDSVLNQLADKTPRTAESQDQSLWYSQQLNSEQVLVFLERALQLEDVDGQIEALKIMATPQGSYGKVSLPREAVSQLVEVVANRQADTRLRQEAVRTLLHLYEHERKKLYSTLRDLGSDGHFAVEPIVEALRDRSRASLASRG